MVSIKEKTISALDSLYNDTTLAASQSIKLVCDYFIDSEIVENLSNVSWKSALPQQPNAVDCGIYTVKYAEFISRGRDDFLGIEKFCSRTLMSYEILRKIVIDN